MGMTQTSTAAAQTAAYTLASKSDECSWLDLIGWAKGELVALEAGMVNQSAEQRRLQNRSWNAQHEALTDIVRVALAADVDPDAIMAITHA